MRPFVLFVALLVALVAVARALSREHVRNETDIDSIVANLLRGNNHRRLQVYGESHGDGTPPPLADLSSSILVTGAAGFIGFHLASHLHKVGFKTVVGLDTFNAYYSPALKRERASILRSEDKVEVVDGDVCDAELLQSLFEKYKFTHVVHLAAQAGVRYSLVQPLTYIQTNLKCFTILLEQIRSVGESGGKMPHLLYASSSSVYGLNTKIPFSERDPVEMPSNLYGATKRANELMAYSYFHLFGISSIGFRFFTVYGPMGRPDMAAYIFTDRTLRGDTITVYNEGKMKRDFTYVDDIVSGLTAALNYQHEKPAVFNLGNNKPEETMYFLSVIEKELGMKAKVTFEDSKAEIPVTYANVTLAYNELGFQAKTSIEEGMQNFIGWYKKHETERIACESNCHYGSLCTRTNWAAVVEKSREATKGCQTVVYTIALGDLVESLHHVDNFWDSDAELASSNGNHIRKCSVAFVSTAGKLMSDKSMSGNWTVVGVELPLEGEIRKASRLPKISPELFFDSSVRHAIFVDNRLGLVSHPNDVVQLMKMDDKEAFMMAMRHPRYKTMKQEVSSLLNKELTVETAETILQQQLAYDDYAAREKLTFDNVIDASMLVHDLSRSEGHGFRCKWYREFQDWSDRDQLAAAFIIAMGIRDAGALGTVKPTDDMIPVMKDKSQPQGQQLRYIRLLPADKYHWTNTNSLLKFGRWDMDDRKKK